MTIAAARIGGQTKTTPRATNAGATATKEYKSLSQSQDIPAGLCQCGCGQRTNLAVDTRMGRVRGRPVRYIYGHNNRRSGVDFIAEDRGYDTPCWIWQLATDKGGYGLTWAVGGIGKCAHRVYYERHVGPIPEGLQLDHLCRVHSCVNPAHLEPVTAAVNSQRGNTAKLDPEKVRQIRASSASDAELALRFGVDPRTIRSARRGETWAELPLLSAGGE